MKPILIFFYGDANTGKTNVLKKLGEWFRYRCTEYIELRDDSKSTDLKLSIKYRKTCRIGIGTSGDDLKAVMKNIRFFLSSYFSPTEDVCIFITAARHEHSNKSFQRNATMKQLLSQFMCADVPRNAARIPYKRKDGKVKIVREDDLFVYLQTVIQKKQPLAFSLN